MEPKEITYHVQLKAAYTDMYEYTTYVFENLDYSDVNYRYIMCVRFPNWDQSALNIGDVGYVNVRYVREGLDKWFDGVEFKFYRYSSVIFLKFVHETLPVKLEAIPIN